MTPKRAWVMSLGVVWIFSCGRAPLGGEFNLWPVEPTVQVAPLPNVLGTGVLEDLNPDPRIVEVNLQSVPAMVSLSPTRNVQMYTFNGQFPGPLLQARKGDRVIVHFTNNLPEPTTIHWHGLRISDQMDGSPRIQSPVPPGGTFTYDFVVPDAGSFWYHPHVHANEQIEKGLYGPIAIHDAEGVDPTYDAERSIILDDILLDGGNFEPFLAGHMEAMMGRYGNVLLTNGRVEGKDIGAIARRGDVERWRIVNTANARTMEMTLKGASFRIIGTDGGRVPAPYLTTRLIVPVGRRYDLEVTYDQEGSATFESHVASSDAQGNPIELVVPVFAVSIGPGRDPVARSVGLLPVMARQPNRTVDLEINAVNDPVMGFMWQLNGQSHPTAPLFTFNEGDTVRIRLTNLLGPEHPFHLHGQFFTEANLPEAGLFDVVLIDGQATRDIIAYVDNPGRWMAHCHNLEHSEMGMMGEIIVTPKPQ